MSKTLKDDDMDSYKTKKKEQLDFRKSKVKKKVLLSHLLSLLYCD